MYPTAEELSQLLGQCETALSTVRRTLSACPGDIVARVSLPPLEASLVHLIHDVRGWLDNICLPGDTNTNIDININNTDPSSSSSPSNVHHHLPSSEHYRRLRDFVQQSNQSIIYPQARKLGLKVQPPPYYSSSSSSSRSSLSSSERITVAGMAYLFTLFVVQGLTVVLLDKFQSSTSPWAGSGWAPHLCALLATYVSVLQYQASWTPTLCYLLAQGVCLRVAVLVDAWRILGLLVLLANILAATSSAVGMREAGS